MKVQASKDAAIQAYVKLIRTAEALHVRVSRGLIAEGLTASQFSAMKVLRLHGALPQRDIAKYLLQSGGNITLVVDNLERDGLAQRVRSVEDRRIVLVTLTKKGEELFDKIYPGHLDRIREAMGPLDVTRLEELLSLLEAAGASDSVCCTPTEEGDAKEASLARSN
ncbi:MAG: MarR family transcriptional regulator [Armatimonadetes bacterium]|nr:MarR family transcriptional regulator [Armatimonadota bacterium]MBS1726494.1 MarR family transcriptional regulator [Armatimonadota bacterium]